MENDPPIRQKNQIQSGSSLTNRINLLNIIFLPEDLPELHRKVAQILTKPEVRTSNIRSIIGPEIKMARINMDLKISGSLNKGAKLSIVSELKTVDQMNKERIRDAKLSTTYYIFW